ncbi:helix-turn-helix domain-containing protein [Pseudoclavibacter helvolus]|uniref:Excisionase family DNA binding protein n=1 Tax=Pseudoclavibacter helvolus TaxID=255205 RepID=A0A7W4UMN6_9MICO|nr:helix-turn-helix domain-containing protein [Pseudoclavibacter helvolus]MBB2957295.1 excisionase family DNA binding protein [Pseudoclavibacter helvolus]
MSTAGLMTLAKARDSSDAVLSRREVAEILGVDPRTVTAGIDAGEIPVIRVGRRVLIPKDRFLALFASAEVKDA